ncbi:hypothetical protein TNCV_106091 [Trichonephila clavipes]|nr:hypothetical protein TNCV_106091 [Trichonephila clavipes]
MRTVKPPTPHTPKVASSHGFFVGNYGHQLVIGESKVRVLMALKTGRVEGADALKICRAQAMPLWLLVFNPDFIFVNRPSNERKRCTLAYSGKEQTEENEFSSTPQVAQLGEFKNEYERHTAIQTNLMTLMILRLRMPLRRNRRQYEQLTDFDRKIGLKEAGWSNAYRPPPRSERYGNYSVLATVVIEGRVYRRGGSGRPRNTNDREDRAIRRVATSAPTTLLASIQRHLPPSRHPVPSRETIKETTDRSWLEEQTSAKTLTTDPTKAVSTGFLPTSWSVTDWRRVK